MTRELGRPLYSYFYENKSSFKKVKPPFNQNHHIFLFCFKGEQHVGVKIEPAFKKGVH